MSTIRRQSIISSGIVYFGFGLGALNTYLLTREHGGFMPDQYGLVSMFVVIGTMMYSFSNLGMQSYVFKFYPYYNDNLPHEKNDMMSWALLVSMGGFILVILAGYIFKDLVIRKYEAESPELIKYYNWIFPFGFGLSMFTLLEAYAWQLKRSALTNFLREVLFRLFTTTLIVLTFTGALASFDTFIKIYAFTYIILASILLSIIVKDGQLHLTLTPSRVTKKFLPKIKAMATLVWGGTLVYNTSTYFANLVIASVVVGGLSPAAVYTLAQYIAMLMQAPQRSIISVAIGQLSKAWKDKDLGKINRIYQRSSINQLIFSVAVFILIWINFEDGVTSFHLKSTYLAAKYVFLYLGLKCVIDMGTGLNAQVISTSSYWRFDFFTGVLLVAMTLPLNYILAKRVGVTGPAIADLITFTIYNGIRWLFLYRKFNMQPFTNKTVLTILLGSGGYLVCYLLFKDYHGFLWIVVRSLTFIVIYGAGVLGLNLSEDVLPVWKTLKKRLGLGF